MLDDFVAQHLTENKSAVKNSPVKTARTKLNDQVDSCSPKVQQQKRDENRSVQIKTKDNILNSSKASAESTVELPSLNDNLNKQLYTACRTGNVEMLLRYNMIDFIYE